LTWRLRVCWVGGNPSPDPRVDGRSEHFTAHFKRIPMGVSVIDADGREWSREDADLELASSGFEFTEGPATPSILRVG
jgi:hypothetical protein